MKRQLNYRIKYWVWISADYGEWRRTGLTTKESAEIIAKSLRKSHEQVEIYFDDDGKAGGRND